MERFQFATERDRDAYVQALNDKLLSERQAFERGHMSPHIRPQHHHQCITTTVVGKQGALECDAPTHIREEDIKPAEALARLRVVIEIDGRETKTPIVNDPRDAVKVSETVPLDETITRR